MKKMLIIGLSQNKGGTENVIYQFVIRNKERYQFAFLIDSYEQPCYFEEFSSMGFSFFFVYPRKKNLIRNIQENERVFRKNKFDCCFFHLNSLSPYYLIQMASRFCSDIFILSHNSSVNGYGFKTKLLHTIGKIQLPRIPAVRLACSQIAGEFLFGNSPFHVVHNGIDPHHFYFDINLREQYRQMFLLGNQKALIHVGRLRPAKNHRFLLQIFDCYHKKEPNSRLFLVGDGELNQQLHNKVIEMGLCDSVEFLGNRTDVNALLNMSDIFLLPSLHEGFPLSILEAVGTGLPTIISDTVSNEIAMGMYTRFLPIGEGKEHLWANKIDESLSLCRENGNRILRDSQFDIDSFIQNLNRIIQENS